MSWRRKRRPYAGLTAKFDAPGTNTTRFFSIGLRSGRGGRLVEEVYDELQLALLSTVLFFRNVPCIFGYRHRDGWSEPPSQSMKLIGCRVPVRSSAMIAQLGIHSSRSSMSLTLKLCVLSRNRCSDRMRDSNILWTGYIVTVRYADEGVSRL